MQRRHKAEYKKTMLNKEFTANAKQNAKQIAKQNANQNTKRNAVQYAI